MSLSEISVAKDLIPEELKVAWRILFLSLSSCGQRENTYCRSSGRDGLTPKTLPHQLVLIEKVKPTHDTK